jgi:hypothetical protein
LLLGRVRKVFTELSMRTLPSRRGYERKLRRDLTRRRGGARSKPEVRTTKNLGGGKYRIVIICRAHRPRKRDANEGLATQPQRRATETDGEKKKSWSTPSALCSFFRPATNSPRRNRARRAKHFCHFFALLEQRRNGTSSRFDA